MMMNNEDFKKYYQLNPENRIKKTSAVPLALLAVLFGNSQFEAKTFSRFSLDFQSSEDVIGRN